MPWQLLPSFVCLADFTEQVLSGMVAITAPCDVATPTASAVIGLLSGLLVPLRKLVASDLPPACLLLPDPGLSHMLTCHAVGPN